MIRSSQRSNAITNKIKTYFTLYLGKETSGEVASGTHFKPLRIDMSGTSLAGTSEEITSDIILPESRIPSTPEVGSESNSGDIPTEWNIDEQDELFAAVFCSAWSGDSSYKSLTLADVVNSFSMLKKYSQTPVAYQLFSKEYINQLTMDFATDAFVKLTWNVMGSNNPQKVASDPLSSKSPVYDSALTTKSFLTKQGWLRLGDSVNTLVPVRQSPSMNITINNNLERTPALFEEESIENSLGNFDVTGTFDVYNVDDLGHSIYNDAVAGKDKVLQVCVKRKVNETTYSYVLTMNVHLGAPTESRNGNKLQFSVPFTMNDKKDLLLEKVVGAELPAFSKTNPDATYEVDATPTDLDGTATVSDGGTVTYQWYTVDDGTPSAISGETDATLTPDTDAAGTTVYRVVATNTNGSLTATRSMDITVTVTES